MSVPKAERWVVTQAQRQVGRYTMLVEAMEDGSWEWAVYKYNEQIGSGAANAEWLAKLKARRLVDRLLGVDRPLANTRRRGK